MTRDIIIGDAIAIVEDPYRRAIMAHILDGTVISDEERRRFAADAEEIAVDVARALRRCVEFGDVGDEFDALYVDLGDAG